MKVLVEIEKRDGIYRVRLYTEPKNEFGSNYDAFEIAHSMGSARRKAKRAAKRLKRQAERQESTIASYILEV